MKILSIVFLLSLFVLSNTNTPIAQAATTNTVSGKSIFSGPAKIILSKGRPVAR